MRNGDCLVSGGKLDLTRGGWTWKYRLSRLEAHPQDFAGRARFERGAARAVA